MKIDAHYQRQNESAVSVDLSDVQIAHKLGDVTLNGGVWVQVVYKKVRDFRPMYRSVSRMVEGKHIGLVTTED